MRRSNNSVTINGHGFGSSEISVVFGDSHIDTVTEIVPMTVAAQLISNTEARVTVPQANGTVNSLAVNIDLRVKVGTQISNFVNYRYDGYRGERSADGLTCSCERCNGAGAPEMLSAIPHDGSGCTKQCREAYGETFNCHQ
jgi:hypothetical protein